MLQRRLQILVDEERYERIAAEAERRNLSVGAVVREAIDRAYGGDREARATAARHILEAEQMPVPDPEELKAELEEIRAGGL